MARSSGEAVCARCSRRIDFLRAPYLRASSRAQYVFCSLAHAEDFVFPEVAEASSDAAPPPAREREAESLPLPEVASPALSSFPEPPSERPPESLEVEEAEPVPVPAQRDLSVVARPTLSACLALAAFPFAASKGAVFVTAAALLLLGLLEAFVAKSIDTPGPLGKKIRKLVSTLEARDEAGEAPRTGELLHLAAGEVLRVDATIEEGNARAKLSPFLPNRPLTAPDFLFAGTILESGKLVVRAKRTGSARAVVLHERATKKLTYRAKMASGGFVWTVPLVVLSLGVGYLLGSNLANLFLLGAALAHVVSSPLRRAVESSLLLQTEEELLDAGVLLPGRTAFESMARVTTLVLSTRGTILRGQPEVCRIETFGHATEREVLGLAAGAESVVTHPLARALALEIERRRESPLDCRNHRYFPGLGVTCTLATGEDLVVGSRDLLLRERILLASFEPRLEALEAEGNLSLLVAKGGRFVGAVFFLDAVHRDAPSLAPLLAEAKIEPVLLSGDPTPTTEALAERLGIEHFRAEVRLADRPDVVRRLAEGGAHVAVVGSTGLDDGSLVTAEVAFVLGGPSENKNLTIHLPAGSPLGAARALWSARRYVSLRTRTEVIALTPPAIFLGMVLLALLPAWSLVLGSSFSVLGAYLFARRHP